MKQTLKYSLIVLSLFFLGQNVVNAQEVLDQYKEGGGVATSKKVSPQNDDGSYTITLETFATGTSAVVQKNVPADIVLVLDLTTSMRVSRGTKTRVTARTALSYNMVVNARTKATNYIYNDYQLFGYTENGRYYLYYNSSGSNTRNYIRVRNGNIETTTSLSSATYTTDPDATLVTFPGGNSSILYTGSTRIFDLKEATCAFIEAIEKNDTEKAPEGQTRLGNKFSIITYAGAPPVVEQQLDDIGGMDLDALKAQVWAFDLHNGTYPAQAITDANTQLSTRGHSGTVGDDFTRSVVLFTDGDPYDSPRAQAITSAHESKSTLKASVFTVGMFDATPSGDYNNPNSGSNSNLWKFMNFVSSNYPDATVSGTSGWGTMNSGDGGGNKGYFKDVSGDDVNLSDVFTAIAGAAGGSSATIGTQTQVRDVISSSFAIAFPENVTTPAQKQQWVEQNVKVYTSTIAEDGKSWGTLSPFNATVNYVVEKDQDNVEYDAIRVEGFDYSKDDTKDEHGYTTPATAGNWVGLRYRGLNQPFYAGKKVVIQINIFIKDGVTGGITGTNTQQSGVYVYNEKTQSYDPVNYYEVPSKVLSVTIKITKEGLRSGESATFLVKKASPLLDENNEIVYNAIGKPEPDPATWDVDHKVILTNKSDTDGKEVEKIMIGLDPGFVYEVVEDDWGWAYEMTGTGETMTTSSVTINPFHFKNTEKTEIGGAPIRKHAEAVSINHFGYTIPTGPFQGKQTENYKSSKVESF